MMTFENEIYEGNNNLDLLDALIASIGSMISEEDLKPSLLNPGRVQQMQYAHAIMKKLATEQNLKLSCTMHAPLKSMGSLSLEGDMMEFTDCTELCRAVALASNLEVYPLTSGTLRLVLTFHGLTTQI